MVDSWWDPNVDPRYSRTGQCSVEEWEEKLARKLLNMYGQEVPDPTPMEPPIGYVGGPDLIDTVRNLVRGELLRRHAEEAGEETFEEADDFEIEDDPLDPESPYETDFEPSTRRAGHRMNQAAAAEVAANAAKPTGEPLIAPEGQINQGAEPLPARPSEDAGKVAK